MIFFTVSLLFFFFTWSLFLWMCLELGTGQISNTQRRSVDLLGSDGFQLPYSLLMSPMRPRCLLLTVRANSQLPRSPVYGGGDERTADGSQMTSVLTLLA